MISIGKILASVEQLRLTWAQEAVRNPEKENPTFTYGWVAGRDAAAQLILDDIRNMLSEEEDDEDD